MYYSLVGRGLEHEFVSFAQYHNIGILVWSALAGGFLSGKYQPGAKAPEGTRFAEAGQFVMFEPEQAMQVVHVLRQVADRHGVSPARAALAWTLAQPAVSSVIIAARKLDHLSDNIAAAELTLTEHDLRELDAVSHPGTPYPKWMVLQLDQAEDPRPRVLYPERYAGDEPWRDLRFREQPWK
jgi:aryl-alcohol dehydrogenase-like predicted oxidoreductase